MPPVCLNLEGRPRPQWSGLTSGLPRSYKKRWLDAGGVVQPERLPANDKYGEAHRSLLLLFLLAGERDRNLGCPRKTCLLRLAHTRVGGNTAEQLHKYDEAAS
jgi:hypothetical protein